MKLIGVAGYARSGKDTFCAVAKDILEANGIKAKQYSFAMALKEEVKPFLRDVCGVDVLVCICLFTS
jgi:thymidylate kinase